MGEARRGFVFAPSGATGCSHGWSGAALSGAEPVEDVTESRAAPVGAEEVARMITVTGLVAVHMRESPPTNRADIPREANLEPGSCPQGS